MDNSGVIRQQRRGATIQINNKQPGDLFHHNFTQFLSKALEYPGATQQQEMVEKYTKIWEA